MVRRRHRESENHLVETAGGVDDILLERRVVHVHDELDAERDGLRPPLISPNASPSPTRRLLGAPSSPASASASDASDDARWRLLSSGAAAPAELDDPAAPAWTHLEVMGDATPVSFAQFLVATDGDPRVVDALVAAVVPLGGAVGAVVPAATRVVVGDPSVAAAARDVPGVLWVGPLTPQDVTSRAFDAMFRVADARDATDAEANSADANSSDARRLRAIRGAVAAFDADDRALLEVSLPRVVPDAEGRARGVSPSLASALAREFAAGVAAAAADEGAWARPVAPWTRAGVEDGEPPSDSDGPVEGVTRVLVGVRAEGVPEAVRWLAAHRAAQWVAPREAPRAFRPLRDEVDVGGGGDGFLGSDARRRLNEFGGQVVQGNRLAGVTAETPFWDAGIDGDGQIVGCGDTGADRNNCYLSDPNKFVMYRDITAGGSTTDEQGHGTHVVGSIAGRSDEENARADGVARNARVAMTDMATATNGSLELTSNMGSDFFQHAYDAGARVHSDSWGGSVLSYNVWSYEVDEYTHANQMFLSVFAIGNEGPTLFTHSSPGDAKNTMAVGAALSDNSNAPRFDGDLKFGLRAALDRSIVGFDADSVKIWSIDVGGPEAPHWAHLSGLIRGFNVDPKLSDPTAGDHALPLTPAVNAEPTLACDALTNAAAVRGKIALVRLGECEDTAKMRNAVDAGAAGVIFIDNLPVSVVLFNVTECFNSIADCVFTCGYYHEHCDFCYEDDGVWCALFFDVPKGYNFWIPYSTQTTGHSIPAISLPKKDGELLSALVTREPDTTLGISGPTTAEPEKYEHLASFSSAGPTLDGRIKPDVVAPGDSILSANVTNPESDATCALRYLSGTSMATPIAAGAATLLRQYFVSGYYPTGTAVRANSMVPSAALLKAVIINGAQPLRGTDSNGDPLDPPPSPKQGWGRVSLASSVRLDVSGVDVDAADTVTNLIVVDAIESPMTTVNEVRGVCVDVEGSVEALRATLTWMDPPPASVANGAIINDLDLSLYSLAAGGRSERLWPLPGLEDRVNNVERVIWSAPVPGRYWIQAKAFRLAGGSQTFAVAVSGQIVRVAASTAEECGFAPVSPPPTPPSSSRARIAGRVSLVGYLAECGVFLDIDGDGIEDPDEPTATTDAFGGFSMRAPPPGVLAAPIVSRDPARFPTCADSFTGLAPGLRRAYAPRLEPAGEDSLPSADAVVVTPLTTVAAALERRGFSSDADAAARAVAAAFGLPPSVDVRRVDPATASASRSEEGVELMLATVAVANVASSLAALMTRACSGSRADAESYVVAALARKVFAAASGEGVVDRRRSRRRHRRHRRRALLAELPPLDLGDPLVALDVAESAVEDAWNSGAFASRADVPRAAVAGVSNLVARGVAHLRESGSAATEEADPLAVHRAAAAVAAVMQGSTVEDAIAAASAPDDGAGGGNAAASAASLALLVELAEPHAFTAQVRLAEQTVTVQIPGAPPPPPTPSPPRESLVEDARDGGGGVVGGAGERGAVVVVGASVVAAALFLLLVAIVAYRRACPPLERPSVVKDRRGNGDYRRDGAEKPEGNRELGFLPPIPGVPREGEREVGFLPPIPGVPREGERELGFLPPLETRLEVETDPRRDGTPESPKVCAACGERVGGGAKFCSECGTPARIRSVRRDKREGDANAED